MFGKKKTKLGIASKSRTREECDKEYADHCIQIGHKFRIVHQLEQQLVEHQADIEKRTKRLVEINEEAMSIQPEPPTTPTTSPTPESKVA